MLRKKPNYFYGLLTGAWNNSELRLPSITREAVGVVNQKLTRPVKNESLTDDAGQVARQLLSRHELKLRLRHNDAQRVALDSIVDWGRHHLGFSVESDQNMGTPRIDREAIDEKRIDFRHAAHTFHAARNRCERDH